MAKRLKYDPDEVIAEITPQPMRRGLATGMLGLLGFILLSVAMRTPPQSLAFLAMLIVMGAGALWLAWRLWQASGVTIELTHTQLREVGGRVLCDLDNVAKVERGVFAFKPAAGFLIYLREPMGRVYAPGLWWRAGKLLAVGGVTSRSEGKSTADLMNVLLVQRGQADL